ncbi:MAG: cobyric acid synthase [Candidatus Geothermincolia bacterium]
MTASLMIQGTASHVGKSMVVAGLCRLFSDDGVRVAPFKSQNMSLNSCVTPDGGEIARAQELQARAARVLPDLHMNPLLLKASGPNRCEVMALGRSIGNFTSGDYGGDIRPRALEIISESLGFLGGQYDLILIEGAGSPAEVNLNKLDIGNMQVARMTRSPVLLVADIDPGGALAAVVGTLELLGRRDRGLVRGTIINKFRGDPALLRGGLDYLEKKTRRKVVGVLPYVDCAYLDEEDTLDGGPVRGAEVVVVRLPYVSNFTDFEPLAREMPVSWARGPEELDGARLIILPGTRNTLSDLDWLKKTGLAGAIERRAAEGTAVVGICGGYQMLGRRLLDPEGIEAGAGEYDGLGLLPVDVRFESPKVTRLVRARVLSPIGVLPGLEGETLSGYEIHTGRAGGPGVDAPLLLEGDGSYRSRDGACSASGNVFGTHLHGLFNNAAATRALCRFLGREPGGIDYGARAEESLDRLAATMREHLDMGFVRDLLHL